MPLSTPTARDPIHTRRITCTGYLRADELWDIEGHLVDTKQYEFTNEYRGQVPAGQPVHEMWLRLTIDDQFMIRAVEAATDHSPFSVCPAIIPNFQRLVGLSIAKGFINKVRDLLGGVEGCTHLVEMMGPVATTAFQTIFPYRNRMAREGGLPVEGHRKNRLVNTCHAFAEDGEIARKIWGKPATEG